MRRKLTEKQVHTLRFIYDYIKSNDCAPTLKEIGEALGISSTAASWRIFYILEHDCLRIFLKIDNRTTPTKSTTPVFAWSPTLSDDVATLTITIDNNYNTTAPKPRSNSQHASCGSRLPNHPQCWIPASFQQLWLYQLYSLNHLC